MASISARNLTSVDLNLLLVLHVVLRERSVTAAAKRLAVSQSAVSNSLARLRDVFDDLLVVRSGNRLVATPLALELGPRLAAAVEHLERVVQREHVFDPAQSVRTFTLACSDWTQVCDVPIPSFWVPALLVSHYLTFRLLLRPWGDRATMSGATDKNAG
jgi:DNA-binding transcriptional LysR family regulator